jgi:hypothetical protein
MRCDGSGELSVTACHALVQRAQSSGRPVRILYISDFDPAGMSMPLAVARKIEFFNRNYNLGLDVQVRPIVLTSDQCRVYKLPQTPIKDSERRAAAFENRFGNGATELDALEALHPGTLRRILDEEISRYYDPTLSQQTWAASAAIQRDLQTINDDVARAHAPELEALRIEWQAIQDSLEEWRDRARAVWCAMTADLDARAPDFRSIAWPEPGEGREDPEPLFDSRRSYLEQMRIYRRHQGRSAAVVPSRMEGAR